MVVSSDRFNGSAIGTVVLAAVTSNLRLGGAPGNLRLEAGEAELDRESIVNVTQLAAVDRQVLVRRIGTLPVGRLIELDTGLRLVLDL